MVKVRQSTIIDAPIDDVWAILRDFNSHERWHPAIAFTCGHARWLPQGMARSAQRARGLVRWYGRAPL